MKHDFGKLTQAHCNQRANILKSALTLYGIDAQVIRGTIDTDDYGRSEYLPEPEIVYPHEINEEDEIAFTCKVLLDKPIEGVSLTGDISLTDKVELSIAITTDADLKEEDYLVLTFPDGKTIKLRITTTEVKHPFTTIGNKYQGVVI